MKVKGKVKGQCEHFKWYMGVICLTHFLVGGCSGRSVRPCSDGGDPYHAVAYGRKTCEQTKNKFGKYVNNGKYYEWYPNEHIAVIGEYKNGKKHGRWMEFDEDGKKMDEKYFEYGIEKSTE